MNYSFFVDFTFKDWFSIAIGLIVTFGLFAYQKYSSPKQEEDNKILSDFISNFKEKDEIEKTLISLKEQQKSIEFQVKEHIPKLAKQSVLKEQLELHEQALFKHYEEWKKINIELNNNSMEINIEKELETKILESITPKYETIKKLDGIKTKITFYSIIIAITSIFIFSPLNTFIALPFLILILLVIFDYLKLTGFSEKTLNKEIKIIFNSVVGVLLFSICLILFFALAFIIQLYIENDLIIKNGKMYIVFGILIFLAIWAVFLVFYKDKLFNKLMEKIKKNFKIVD